MNAPEVMTSDDIVCVICLEPCSPRDLMWADSCRCGPLPIHTDCQMTWKSVHNECPVCRTPKMTPAPPVAPSPSAWELDAGEPHPDPDTFIDRVSIVTVDPEAYAASASQRRHRPYAAFTTWIHQLMECCASNERSVR